MPIRFFLINLEEGDGFEPYCLRSVILSRDTPRPLGITLLVPYLGIEPSEPCDNCFTDSTVSIT